MTSLDYAELARGYGQEETDELVRIAYVEGGDYLPEAVALAREELQRRGVAAATLAERIEVVREERAARQKVAEKPLGPGVKAVCFLFPAAVGGICAMWHARMGKARAARQALAFTGLGFLARTALLAAYIWTRTY
jgi:hypothetical protein